MVIRSISAAKLFLAAACLLLVAGCSTDSDVRPPASITGTITLDGQPHSTGSIQFTSPDTGETAYANLEEGGRYTVEFPAADVGAVYDVTIGPPVNENEDATAMLENNQAPVESPVPAKYRDRTTSGLTFTLSSDGENRHNIDLQSS